MSEINENAREYLLKGSNDIGIVLTHGFTSSPSYMRFVAEDLNKLGYSVLAPLLAGHGTCEQELRNGYGEKWISSVTNAIEKMRQEGVKKVFAMGHSLGGVLSLCASARGYADGVITVAAPVRIYGYRRVKLFSIFCKNRYYTMNKPDGREDMFRYYRTDGKSLGNLLKMMRRAEKALPKITVPALVIFSRDDKTVMASSGQMIYDGVSSETKELIEITGSHHQCIVDSRNQYVTKIDKFIKENT